jgi:hypothetical protein
MGKIGKILILLGGLFIMFIGAIILGTGGILVIGGPIIAFGLLIFALAFSRLVQGKDRMIMGQMLRPKAAARGSWIWVFICINLVPLVIGNTELLAYLPSPHIPLPALVLGSSTAVIVLAYQWLPLVLVVVIILWILGFILSGKIPKIVYIFNMFVIGITFTFWMNFGLQFILWTFFADRSGLPLMAPWAESLPFVDLLLPLGIGAGITVVAMFLLLRTLKNLQRGFANFNAKGLKQTIGFIFMVLVYGGILAPLYFAISNSLANNTYIASFVNYIGFIFIAIVVFQAVSSLISAAKGLAQSQSVKHEAGSPVAQFGFSTAVFLVLFFLAWAPIVLPLVDQGQNSKNNSIYNTDWNGWSNFREELEGIYPEENIMSIQSSISTLSEIMEKDPSKQIILVIPGPNLYYNPAAEIPYFLTAFKGNFSMFICDDHGTTESLLISMFISSAAAGGIEGATPLTFFPKGILMETAPGQYLKDPAFPIISNFAPHDITTGLSKVVLGDATGFLGGELLADLGWNFLGYTSGHYSFIDTNNDGVYNQSLDVYPFPAGIGDLLASQSGALGMVGTFLSLGFPLGGYAQAVFSMKEIAYRMPSSTGNGLYSSRVFVATDATWLNNELTQLDGYDNLQMGVQAMDWLACNRNPEDTIIVFDEAHLRPESGRTELNSAASFGATQGYVNWLSTNPILGLVYPLFALSTLRKWIPKEGSKKELQLHDLEEAERTRSLLKFRTSSFFAQKINWYRAKHKYKQALLQLHRRIARKVNRLLGDSPDRSISAVMTAIHRERGKYLSPTAYKRIEEYFNFIKDLKTNKITIKDEQEFESWFMKMSWVSDKI